MTLDESTSMPWWGSVTLAPRQVGRWQIGPLTLWATRTETEWLLAHHPAGDPLDRHSDVAAPLPDDEAFAILEAGIGALGSNVTVQRFGFRTTGASLSVTPVVADRPVVVQPEHALFVPPGEHVTLFVSTPLWVRVAVDNAELIDLPSHRPSDTWFGASTVDGELCYASWTLGRTDLDAIPLRPHRAVTPMRLHNRTAEALRVERVQIPAPNLTLYRADDHVLWTNGVTVVHEKTGEGAPVQIDAGAPRMVPDATRLQSPRQEVRKNLAISTFRAIESLFGHG